MLCLTCALLLATPSPAQGVVEVRRDVYQTLREAAQPPAAPVEAPPTRWLRSDVALAPEGVEDGAAWQIDATWTVDGGDRAAWVELAGPGLDHVAVTVDGAATPTALGPSGLRAELPPGLHRVRLTARSEQGAIDLREAAVRRVTLAAPGFVVQDALELDGAWWPARGPLQLAAAPPPARHDAVVGAEVALGLTVADDVTRVAARVVLTPLRGRLDDTALAVTGLPPGASDLAIDAPAHARVAVAPGGPGAPTILHVDLDAPSASPLALGLTWTATLPAGAVATLPVPRVEVPGALRVQRTLLVAREQGLSLAPELRGGAAVLPERLPAPTRALVTGTPVLAREGDATGDIRALRVQAAPSPALFVDVADWRAVITPEGRWLAQGRLTVRNERAASLDLTLPPGVSLEAVVVDGRPVAVTLLPDQRVRIPLPRSVETVSGALAFPVELGVRGQAEVAAGPRATWSVRLPAPDAPIAVRRVTAHLPRGWADAEGAGDRGQVASFTEGDALAWTFGGGAIREDAAEGLYRDAVDAWLRNDLGAAQGKLDELRAVGVDNHQVVQLQDNLDALGLVGAGQGGGGAADSSAIARVREFAQARALDDARDQADALDRATRAAEEGDYAGAEAALAQVAETSERLRAIEAPEVARQEVVAGAYEALRKEVGAKKAESATEYTFEEEIPLKADIPVGASLARAAPVTRGPMAPPSAPAPSATPRAPGHPTPGAAPARAVTATRAALAVPETGAAVRFQHTLLPQGDLAPVEVCARAARR
jgi:hypothetical protein